MNYGSHVLSASQSPNYYVSPSVPKECPLAFNANLFSVPQLVDHNARDSPV